MVAQRLCHIYTQRADRRIPVDANADRQPWLPTETVEVFGERSDRVRISGVRRAARACAPECIGIACLAGRDLARIVGGIGGNDRSEEHTSELQSLMRISYAVFCLKKKNKITE